MFPQPKSKPELRPDELGLDPICIFEEHIFAGCSPDLSLDLGLNEVAVRAARATHATAAAIALLRNDEMVCRAATGHLAPFPGALLKARNGLSGACLETRQPQISLDAEADTRVDPVISRLLGIRSILIVPVFDINNQAKLTGVLEVFSTSPAAFSGSDQKLLEGFAEECALIRQAALERSQHSPDARVVALKPADPGLVVRELVPPCFLAASPPPVYRPPYQTWTNFLAGLCILVIIAFSCLISYRMGWLPVRFHAEFTQPLPSEIDAPAKSCVGTAAPGCTAEPGSTGAAED